MSDTIEITPKLQFVLQTTVILISIALILVLIISAKEFVGWKFWEIYKMDTRAQDDFIAKVLVYMLVIVPTGLIGGVVAARLPVDIKRGHESEDNN